MQGGIKTESVKAKDSNLFYYNSTSSTLQNKTVKHYHSLYEIYYLEQGVCNYLIEEKIYEMLSGDVVFIPKGVIHKTKYENMHSRLLINCSEEYLNGVEIKKPFVYRNSKYSKKIYGIFKSVEAEYLHSDKFSDALIRGYMQQMLATVYRSENEYENNRTQNKYVLKALDFLGDNYTEEITLVHLAAQLKISPEHLSRIFKKETGLGFNEYLSLLRLKKAEAILKQNDSITVSEAAFACGFNDSNYFCEKFKSVYGVSPLKFKNSFKPK